MRKKLLCMLLTAAVVFTSADLTVTAVGRTAEGTQEETGEETAPAQESTEKNEPEDSETEPQTKPEDASTTTDDMEISKEESEPETKSKPDAETEPETNPAEKPTEVEDEENSARQEEETETETEIETETETKTEDSHGTTPEAEYRTIDEIREYLIKCNAAKEDSITYAAEPEITAPYDTGALSETTLGSAAAMVSQIRFIAGLPYEIALNEEYSQLSQAAALVNYANGSPKNTPPRIPRLEDMPEDLYNQAVEGASKSNLAYTDQQSRTLNETIVDTWMADNETDDIQNAAHRRWILNPSMEQIGFGAVKGSNGIYSAMYAMDTSGSEKSIFGVAWPARNMPVEYFDSAYPWSVSTGEKLDSSEIHVTLTRKSDGKEWHFSEKNSDGAFYVDNDAYGQKGCIIFRPDAADIEAYADGDAYQVEVTKNGEDYVNYRVNFFSLTEETEKPEYTVAFESNGGTEIAAQTVQEDEKAIEPDEPVKEGYVFDGWYQEESCENKWDFENSTVTSDITLYANWTEQPEETETTEETEQTEETETTEETEQIETTGETEQSETTEQTETAEETEQTEETETAAEDAMAMAAAEDASDGRTDLNEVAATIAKIQSKVYDGNAYMPTVKVTVKEGNKTVTLTEGVDYNVAYTNNINVGTEERPNQVTVTGIGSYKGTITKTFAITPKSIKKLKIVTGGMTVGDKKSAPPVYVYDGVKRLGNGDYELEYDKETLTEKKTTSAKVIVKAKENGNYKDSVTAKLTVYDAAAGTIINPGNVKLNTSSVLYTGKAITSVEPIVTVKDSETKQNIILEKNIHYKVQYQNNTNAGIAYVIVTGKKPYQGKVVVPFTIKPVNAKDLAAEGLKIELKVKDIPAKTYNGKLQKPAVTVTAEKTKIPETTENTETPETPVESKKLTVNKDYTVTYAKNLNKGTATATITGKGNYNGLKASKTFVINPLKISKTSISIKKNPEIKNKLDVTLTYNKRLLKEGTNYALKYDINEKGNKVQLTITGKGDFTGEVVKNPKSPVFSNNKGQQNYYGYGAGWSKPMNSYMIAEKNGKVTRAEFIGGRVWIETYSPDRTLLTQKQLAPELSMFGGFYEGANNYFLVFGANNKKEENPEAEVIRIVKYSKSWKRQKAVSLKGSDIAVPFDGTSLRMAEYDGKLYVHTGHAKYKTSDGLNHQKNLTLFVDISTMKKIEILAPYGHLASHSFNQYIIADGSDLLFIDQGDYNPRSIRLMKYTKNGENLVRTNSVHVLPIGGSYAKNSNATGVFLGGLEASETAYLVAGASVQQNAASYSPGGQRNLFVTSTQKDNVTAEGTTMHWLTSYSSGVNVSTPQFVKINSSEFLLMWTEGALLKSVLIGASGEPVSGIYSTEGALSDCKPILTGESVEWYYTNNSTPVFCSLNIEEVRKTSR